MPGDATATLDRTLAAPAAAVAVPAVVATARVSAGGAVGDGARRLAGSDTTSTSLASSEESSDESLLELSELSEVSSSEVLELSDPSEESELSDVVASSSTGLPLVAVAGVEAADAGRMVDTTSEDAAGFAGTAATGTAVGAARLSALIPACPAPVDVACWPTNWDAMAIWLSHALSCSLRSSTSARHATLRASTSASSSSTDDTASWAPSSSSWSS